VIDTRPRSAAWPTKLTLGVSLFGPPLFVLISDWLFGAFPSLGVQMGLQLLYCGLAALVLWVVVRIERLPLESIGIRRPTWSTLQWGVVLYGVVYVLPLVTGPLLTTLGTDGLETGMQRLSFLPVWFRVIVGLTGGIVEETLYRGYAIERLSTMSGSRPLAASISAIAFGLAHVPMWGLGFALGADLPFGIVMTLFYLWRRDLLANILVHSTGLVVAMLTAVP
jgi:membrane protease YdiL (CAAX protease family)